MRTQAAVLDRLGDRFQVADVDLDDPRPGEVRVRLVSCGVCHTDAVARQGDLPFPAPGVLGHEGAGRVEAVGDGVSSVAVGDPVLLGWPWCGSCRHCLAGHPRFCLQLGPLLVGGGREDGSTALRRASDGSALHSHFFGQSSFAQHALVAERSLVRLEPDTDLRTVGVLACGVATGAGAVLNTLDVRPGSSLVVFGAGAVGLAAVMAARLTPATTVVVVEPNASRRALAVRYGATDVVDPEHEGSVLDAVREACGGPADAALECTGIDAVVRQATDAVGMLGTCVLIGAAPAGAELRADHLGTLWGKRIVGTLGGEGQSGTFVPALLRLHAQGRFPFTDLVQHFPLDRVEEAVAASASGEVVKPVLLLE